MLNWLATPVMHEKASVWLQLLLTCALRAKHTVGRTKTCTDGNRAKQHHCWTCRSEKHLNARNSGWKATYTGMHHFANVCMRNETLDQAVYFPYVRVVASLGDS